MKKTLYLSLLLGMALSGQVFADGMNSEQVKENYNAKSRDEIIQKYKKVPAVQKTKECKKTFYVTPRIGGSYVNFLESGEDDFDGLGLTGNVAIGAYLGNNFRVDAEVGYHGKREVAEEFGSDVDYKQLDVMLNGYYDIKTDGKLIPFVGIGAGWYKSKFTEDKQSDTDRVVGVSVAGGATYPITDVIAAEGMVRAKYLFHTENALNMDALVGLRFSF